jgi:hypothetical protein
LKTKKDRKYKKISKMIDKKLKQIPPKNQDNKYKKKNIRCTNCGFLIPIKNTHKKYVCCPICEKKIQTTSSKKKQPEKKKSEKGKIKFKNLISLTSSNIIEILIIILGISFLNNPTLPNIKISFSIVLIGTILLVIISDSTISEEEKKLVKKSVSFKKDKKGKLIKTKNFLSLRSIKNIFKFLHYKIAIILIIWILILFFITGSRQVEIFFIFIFIGMLIIRELTENCATKSLKYRLDAFIVVFLIAYVVLIIDKIINILSM